MAWAWRRKRCSEPCCAGRAAPWPVRRVRRAGLRPTPVQREWGAWFGRAAIRLSAGTSHRWLGRGDASRARSLAAQVKRSGGQCAASAGGPCAAPIPVQRVNGSLVPARGHSTFRRYGPSMARAWRRKPLRSEPCCARRAVGPVASAPRAGRPCAARLQYSGRMGSLVRGGGHSTRAASRLGAINR
jgi:hypothetical protein